MREIDSLVRISECEMPAHRLAPALGEHTDAILAALGYDDDRIAALRSRNSIS